jgi:hypothetical protein
MICNGLVLRLPGFYVPRAAVILVKSLSLTLYGVGVTVVCISGAVVAGEVVGVGVFR